jgi:hypothetical protein
MQEAEMASFPRREMFPDRRRQFDDGFRKFSFVLQKIGNLKFQRLGSDAYRL